MPIEEVEHVLLDYQSRTSVALAKILLHEYWQVTPRLIDAKADFRDQIGGTTAAVVIGDRALQQRKKSSFIYDLGEAWKKHTGLPFVFAAWISNKPLPDAFIERFNEANQLGLDNLATVVRNNPYDTFDLYTYFTRYILYRLDAEKREGLELFLEKLKVNK